MPSIDELPEGPVRLFVEELFFHYREAGRLPLRKIAEDILAEDLPGTASRETLRKMLRGLALPEWDAVESVLIVLCRISGIERRSRRYSVGAATSSYEEVTYESALWQLWDEAREGVSNPLLSLGQPYTESAWRRLPD